MRKSAGGAGRGERAARRGVGGRGALGFGTEAAGRLLMRGEGGLGLGGVNADGLHAAPLGLKGKRPRHGRSLFGSFFDLYIYCSELTLIIVQRF